MLDIKKCSRCGCDLVPASFLGLQYNICPYCKGNRYRFLIQVIMALYILVVFTTAAIVANDNHITSKAKRDAEKQAKIIASRPYVKSMSDTELHNCEKMIETAKRVEFIESIRVFPENSLVAMTAYKEYNENPQETKNIFLSCLKEIYSKQMNRCMDVSITAAGDFMPSSMLPCNGKDIQ